MTTPTDADAQHSHEAIGLPNLPTPNDRDGQQDPAQEAHRLAQEPDFGGEHADTAVDRDITAGRDTTEPEAPSRSWAGME